MLEGLNSLKSINFNEKIIFDLSEARSTQKTIGISSSFNSVTSIHVSRLNSLVN